MSETRTRVRRLLGEGTWILTGQVMSVVGSLALVRVLTGRLSPSAYGELSLGLTLGTLTGQIALAGVMPGIMRFYSIAAERDQVRSFLAASARLMRLGTVLTAGLALLVALAAKLSHQLTFGLVILSAAYAQFSNYNSTLSSIQNAARQRAIVALHGGAEPIVRILILLVVFSVFQPTAFSVLWGYLIGVALVVASQLYFLRRIVPWKRPVEAAAQAELEAMMWTYSKPYTIFNLFTWAQASSDRWALNTFASSGDVGHYAVVMQLGFSPIALVTGLLSALLGPILFQRSGDATNSERNDWVHRKSWQLTGFCLAITLIAFLVALAAHGLVFRLFTAREYWSVSSMLPWMLVAGGLFAASQAVGLKLQSDLKTGLLLVPKIVTSLVAVVLNVVGASLGGVRGVVAALVAFNVLHFGWMAVLAWRRDPAHQRLTHPA